MLESFPVSLFIATVLGFLAGLGVGGGSLLVLWLTLVLQTPPEQARVMNLLFFIPGALAATLLRMGKGGFQLKPLVPGILAGCAAAAAGSVLAGILDTALLRKLFGGLLVITGLRELFYRRKKAR